MYFDAMATVDKQRWLRRLPFGEVPHITKDKVFSKDGDLFISIGMHHEPVVWSKSNSTLLITPERVGSFDVSLHDFDAYTDCLWTAYRAVSNKSFPDSFFDELLYMLTVFYNASSRMVIKCGGSCIWEDDGLYTRAGDVVTYLRFFKPTWVIAGSAIDMPNCNLFDRDGRLLAEICVNSKYVCVKPNGSSNWWFMNMPERIVELKNTVNNIDLSTKVDYLLNVFVLSAVETIMYSKTETSVEDLLHKKNMEIILDVCRNYPNFAEVGDVV